MQIIDRFSSPAGSRALLKSINKPAIAASGAVLLLAAMLLAGLAEGQPAGGTAPSAAPGQPVASVASTSPPYDWMQFNFDPSHSGNNPFETTISEQNVGELARLFQSSLPGVADGSPAYLAGVNTPSGTKDLLFVTTKAGDIAALDAHTGSQLWIQHNPAGECRINNRSQPCYNTSSPALDPNRQYVYSYGQDGKVHKYQVADGTEVTGGGWPQVATIKPYDEKGSSALAVATAKDGTSYLYVANSGYLGDRGDYQGHVTAIDLANGTQNVFNSLCSNNTSHLAAAPQSLSCGYDQSGIWARSGVVYDPSTDRIYASSGNGSFDPVQHAWGDTVFAINPDGTGSNGDPLDGYTPSNYQELDTRDIDLGSTAPAILPSQAGSKVPHLGVQGGKDGMLRLLNMDNLSGQGSLGRTGGEVGAPIDVPQGGEVLTAPAVWVNPADSSVWVFVATSAGISGLKLNVDGSGNPSLQPLWKNGSGGTSPIIANGVLYYASSSGIRALEPTSGAQLWQDPAVTSFHWESPIVANGVLYITDENGKLTAYGLPSTP